MIVLNSLVILTQDNEIFFYLIMLIGNIIFFSYWGFNLLSEIRAMLITKYTKVYLCLFLCGNQRKLNKLYLQEALREENELLRENFQDMF